MNKIELNIEKFTQELTLLQRSLAEWHKEVSFREQEITKQQVDIRRQREELIQKSNLIINQVNGLRAQKDAAIQKMIEAEKLKKTAVEMLESSENKMAEISLRENDLLDREKNIKLADWREKKIKADQEKLEIEQANLLKAQSLLEVEKDLLDDKQKALVIRENKLHIQETKQRKIMNDL
jgi:hypothetical protein